MRELKISDITEPIAVIKNNKSYRDGMSEETLYDCTRGCWKNRLDYVASAKYALATTFGEVKEVYEIDSCMPAKMLNRENYPYNPKTEDGRIGFSGKIASDNIRNKYLGKSVKGLFKRGDMNPVRVFLPE